MLGVEQRGPQDRIPLPDNLNRDILTYVHAIQIALIQRDAAWLESPGSILFEDFNAGMHQTQRTTIEAGFRHIVYAIAQYNETRPTEQPATHQNNELIALTKILYTLYHRRQREWLNRRNYYAIPNYIEPFLEQQEVPTLVECLETYNRLVPEGARVFPRDVVALEQSQAVYDLNPQYNRILIQIDLMRNSGEPTEQERIEAGLTPHAIYPTRREQDIAIAQAIQRARTEANQPRIISHAQQQLQNELDGRLFAVYHNESVAHAAPGQQPYPAPPPPRPNPEVAANGRMNSDPSDCSICLGGIDPHDPDYVAHHRTVCNHRYHIECLRRWFARGAYNCPMCKRDLTPSQ